MMTDVLFPDQFKPVPNPAETGIRHILIIDDESSVRSMLASLATDMGYHATTLEDAGQFEARLEDWPFELVLCDIRMPEMNGVDALRRIKERHPLTLVIMVTGVMDMATVIEAMKAGAADYITKPVDPDILEMAIHRANDIYLLKKENKEYRDGLEKLVQKRTEQLYRFADALSKKNQMFMRANRELQAVNDKLQNYLNQVVVSNKVSTLGLLSSMLIHGIANPLGVISGIMDVLQKRHSDDMTQKELAMMRQYLNQTLELVSQVRLYARTESTQFARINLADIVRHAVSLVETLNKKKSISIVNRIQNPALFVQGDRGQLEHVLVNVLQNALEAIEGKGTVEIAEERDGPGDVRLVIRDSGAGISPEHLQKIFKMFFTTKSAGKGTGLGLFICKEIMEKHGGSIRLESEPQKGTTVHLQLKLAS